MKAAIYARFSTEKQRDASIDDQMRECERVAKAAGLSVLARFDDKGISGGTHTRPGYQALLTAARNHAFDVIVVEDITRLWRNRAEFGPRSAELEDLGIHCVTCVGDDTRRDGWGLVIQIKQAVGEYARRESSYRTRRGLEGKAIAGGSTGGRAYGYVAAKDADTKQIEVQPDHAKVVRRIFKMYADGISARNIASALNEEGILSPGAAWKRTARRTDAKWLASAIHGDITRGTGILNNRRYTGVTTWGRSEWKRSAADSAKRKHRLLPAGSAHEHTDERLRIVPQDLWERVKARQRLVAKGVGKLIKGGQRRNRPGAGRPPRHLFSGLLACGECGASFVLRNRTSYCCASYWNGNACKNAINVPVRVVQDVMLKGIREDLDDPVLLKEFEARAKAALRQPIEKLDHGKRIAQLRQEVGHLTDAIAQGVLRTSPAIAQRLQDAEGELARLAQQPQPRTVTRLVPDLHKEYRELADGIDQVLLHDPSHGREQLRGVLDGKIQLRPDKTRRYLWADYGLGLAVLTAKTSNAEIMVAGARYANYLQLSQGA